jgi:transcriptional regulator with XRE-family HTH domain
MRRAMEPVQHFAANLRRYREDQGLSQEDLGFRAGIHRTEISLLERAGREPRLGTIVKLAYALQVAPTEMLAGIPRSEDQQTRS